MKYGFSVPFNLRIRTFGEESELARLSIALVTIALFVEGICLSSLAASDDK